MKHTSKIKMRLLASLMSLAMLLTPNMIVSANTELSGEGETTATTPSEFEADDSASGIVVKVPANLDLDFSQELDSYQITANVGVYGDMKDFGEVAVSVNEEILYSDGQLPSGSSEYSKTLPELTSDNETYPYVYEMKRLGQGTNGSNAYATLVDVVFESKGPMFLTVNSDKWVKLYGYYNGEVSEINKIKTDDTNSQQTCFVVSDSGSVANGAIPAGFMRVKSLTTKLYSSYDGTCAGITEFQKNQVSTYGCMSLSTIIGNDNAAKTLVNNFGLKHLETSCLVFNTPTAGKEYFSYDADDYSYVTGKVRFGENANGVCTETWNSNQVSAGTVKEEDGTLSLDENGKFIPDEVHMDNRIIMINVPSYEVTSNGIYYATAEFNISFSCVGQHSDIAAATKLQDRGLVQTGDGYTWDNSYTPTVDAIYLNKLHTEANDAYMDIAPTSIVDNEDWQKIKYIQLAESGTPLYTRVSDVTSTECSSWIFGLKGLQVLVIPSTFEKEDLHVLEDGTVSYDNTAVFEDTNKKIGNALVFVKNIDANGKFIYVPHICYRGTKEEFKALSGSDNWNFSNAGNIVTVHCTDGVMYY